MKTRVASRRRLNGLGYSFVELLTAIVIFGIVAAIAAPALIQWRQTLVYRESARDVASVLREARARAIASNREHRVELEPANIRYRMVRGNRSSGTNWVAPNFTVIRDWTTLPNRVGMRRDVGCGNVNAMNIEFNPNGTSENGVGAEGVVCIMDVNNASRYLVRVATTSGRIRIQ